MLGFRKSLINVKGNTLSLTNSKGKVSLLSGTAIYDRNRKGYFATVEITPGKKRDLRFYALYADGSPCNSWVKNNKILTEINLEHIPEEFKLVWLGNQEIDYPDIFNSLVSYINENGFKKAIKINNHIKEYLWIYDLLGDDKDVEFNIVAKKPIKFQNKLEVLKVYNGTSECLYSGTAPANKTIKVPVKFNLDTLEYENFSLYLNWYDENEECAPEIINTEFIKQNEPDNNYQLPSVNVDDMYLSYYGKSPYKVTTSLDSHQTVIDYDGLLNGSSVEICFRFAGSAPDTVSCKSFRFNGQILKDLFVERCSEKIFNLELWSTLFQHQQVDTAVLLMEYTFEEVKIEHIIDITKIYSK